MVQQRAHPVRYEYGRLGKIIAGGFAAYLLSVALPSTGAPAKLACYVAVSVLAFPLVLMVFPVLLVVILAPAALMLAHALLAPQ